MSLLFTPRNLHRSDTPMAAALDNVLQVNRAIPDIEVSPEQN